MTHESVRSELPCALELELPRASPRVENLAQGDHVDKVKGKRRRGESRDSRVGALGVALRAGAGVAPGIGTAIREPDTRGPC